MKSAVREAPDTDSKPSATDYDLRLEAVGERGRPAELPAERERRSAGIVFREKISGVRIPIHRSPEGDEIRFERGETVLLSLRAAKLAAPGFRVEGPLDGSGVKTRGLQLWAFVYDGVLHAVWDVPFDGPQGLLERGKRAQAWVGNIVKLRFGAPICTRMFVPDGDRFSEVIKGPTMFRDRRIALTRSVEDQPVRLTRPLASR